MSGINVENLTFGVEIETTIPRGVVRVGPHRCGESVPGLEGWKADRDPSIRVDVYGREACEFVSPVFRGADGLRQLLADFAKIKAMGAKVNGSCGLHIHVGFDKQDEAGVVKLTTLVSNFEKAIYASTGTKNRERGRWCGGLNRYGDAGRAIQQCRYLRYHVLNLATGGKPTVEFRAFSATLNAAKVVGYIRLCVGLVERSLRAKRKTDWTAKTPAETSPIRRSGEGQTALNRLFYQLGWTKGRQKHVHGDLSGAGLPGLSRIKKEMIRLAAQYDSQP
jgi:hypothetical protein